MQLHRELKGMRGRGGQVNAELFLFDHAFVSKKLNKYSLTVASVQQPYLLNLSL